MTTPLHMACYGDLRAWFRRRRRVIFVAAGAVGAGCLLYYGFTRYGGGGSGAATVARPRAVEEQQDDQERLQHLRRHCEDIQQLADATTLPPLLSHLNDRLFELVSLSELTRQLLAGKQGPQALSHDEKINLWQKLKILSFTRTLCAAWGLGLVQIFVRVQLNLLGRHLFISAAAAADLPALTAQRRFLALGDFLPLHGIPLLVRDVEAAVTEVMEDISLKKTYSFDELRDLLIRIQAVFEQQQKESYCRFLLSDDDKLPEEDYPAAAAESSSSSSISEEQLLVAKVREIVSSVEFQSTAGAVFDALLDTVMQELLPHYQNQPAVGLPLAKLVPAVSSVGMLLENIQENKYVRAVAELTEVKSFSAMVYGSAA